MIKKKMWFVGRRRWGGVDEGGVVKATKMARETKQVSQLTPYAVVA